MNLWLDKKYNKEKKEEKNLLVLASIIFYNHLTFKRKEIDITELIIYKKM